MKRIFFPLAIALVVFATAVQAQETVQSQETKERKSTMRIDAQHKPPSGMEKHLAQYEVNTLKTLETGNATVQAQAVQTMRDLEQMFPMYTFETFLAPLEKKLKDEKADPVVRRLAALALDELHSDAGDSVIKDVANSSDDKGLQTLCRALLVKTDYK
jgi:hypothetical protein